MRKNDEAVYFNRYIALLAMAGQPEFADFLTEVRPQVVQMGFYGPQLYALAETDKGSGYPMSLPVRGIREVLAWQKEFNKKVHDLGGKVLGHFSMTVAWGEPTNREGFFQFYDEFWQPELLGEKPVEDIKELLMRLPDGGIHVGDRYGFPRTAGCNNSPYWREFQKRMVRVAIEECDVDGFVTLYNYDYGCACEYCNEAFRKYLRERYSPKEISDRFGIEYLDSFKLDGTLAHVTGWIDDSSPHPAPLQIESMRFAQISWKRAFDEAFIEYGRHLKPDLILGMWNHLGFLSVGSDERNVTPKELWGRGEQLFWYSTGGQAGTISDGDAGVRMLNLKWIWELSGHKLPVLGRYERTRIRASIAEALANQGPGMGLYCTWNDEVGRKAFVDYFNFARKYYDYYHPVESFSEVSLVFPRQSVQVGDAEPVDDFRLIGQGLLDKHILFDVLSDENISAERLNQYLAVILPNVKALSSEQCEILSEYVKQGGLLITTEESSLMNLAGERLPRSMLRDVFNLSKSDESAKRQKFGEGWLLMLPIVDRVAILNSLRNDIPGGISEFDAPWMVRVTAFSQPERLAFEQSERIILHLVNYNCDETGGSGPADEKPIAVTDIGVNLKLPAEADVESVMLISPDYPQSYSLNWQQAEGRVTFLVPSVLVYGVVVVFIRKL